MSTGRGEFKRVRQGADVQTVKTEALFDIGEADVESELASIKKIRTRLEKNNERLQQQEDDLVKVAEGWQKEIESLEQAHKTKTDKLEQRLKDLEFDWAKDRQTEEREIEKLSAQFDSLENEQEDREDKLAAKQKAALYSLNEELEGFEKSVSDKSGYVDKMNAMVETLEARLSKLREDDKSLRSEIEKGGDSLTAERYSRTTLETQLQETAAKDEGLREDLKAKLELEESIANTKREIKKFQKDEATDKKEQVEMNELRDQIKKITDKNNATTTEIAKLEEEFTQAKEEKVKEKEKAQNEKKATSDSTTTGGEEDKEGDNFKSDAERQIEEAEIENAALEAAWQEKKIDLEYKLEFAQKDNEVIKGKVERINDDIKGVQDELNQIREVHRGDMKEKTDTIKASEAELKKIELEIEKQQKELIAKRSKDLVKLRNDLHEKTFDLTQTNQSFAIASFILAALSVTEERLATELTHITTNTNETRAVLKKTELELQQNREEGATLQEDLRTFVKAQEVKIEKYTEELFKEVLHTDAVIKERNNLKMEVARLRGYMKKDLIHATDSDGPSDKELAISNYLVKMIELRKQELQSITKPLKAARPKIAKSLDDLGAQLKTLIQTHDEYWQDIQGEIAQIDALTKKLKYSATERLQLFVDIVENELHVGVVLEIILILQKQVDAEVVIGLSTMQHIMWLAKRDVNLGVVDDDEYVKSGRSKKHGKLSEALLRRLAVERYNRTKNERKVISYCVIVILEGGEEWPDNEFDDYLKELNATEEAAALKVDEQKKLWAAEKEKWKKAREERTMGDKK